MGIDLRRLRMFVAVAQSGTLTRAAQRLHMAQPPLSRQIATLEREIGFELFVRSRNGMRLTTFGTELYEQAENVLSEFDKIQDNIATFKNKFNQKISIGISDCIHMIEYINKILGSYIYNFSNTNLEIRSFSSDIIEEMIIKKTIDVGLTWGCHDNNNLKYSRIHNEKAGIFFSKKDNYESNLNSFMNKAIVLPSSSKNRSINSLIMEYINKKQLSSIFYTVDTDISLIIPIISSGIGGGILPVSLISSQLDSFHFVDIDENELSFPVYVVTRKEKLSPSVKALTDHLKHSLTMTD
ncbi:LysR family transcriptional regulator [Asaia siamensis]